MVFGDGPDAILCFHGFGIGAQDFQIFEKFLKNRYTFYAINNLFHGNSQVEDRNIEKEPLKPEELKDLIQGLQKKESIEKFSLLAYSLGGRMALKIAELIPEQISSIFLFAPDGVELNAWYKIASRSGPGRALYRASMKHYSIFEKAVRFLAAVKIVNPKIKQLVLGSTNSKEKRKLAYKVWTFLRLIEPNMRLLQKLMGQYAIKIEVYVGKYDRILPPSTIRIFEKHFKNVRISKLKAGHVLFKEELIRKIIEEGGLVKE